ncbi:unnamed protein product [Angiostrongylus costaricensis]|uniref:Transposase n=1 Tax=Angiostrongylus costaricensis TaxID=334426 RepID=A0A0R3PTE6_ANGCS|nr:unnamed protein product [Angiostrongylus costaricensis]
MVTRRATKRWSMVLHQTAIRKFFRNFSSIRRQTGTRLDRDGNR